MKRACLCLIALISISVCAQITNDPGDLPNSKLMKLNIGSSKNITVTIILPDITGVSPKRGRKEHVPAKEIIYRPKSGVETYSLAAVRDPYTQKNYIVPSSCDFYISDSSGMKACRLALGGDLVWCKSYFEAPESSNDLNATIVQFMAKLADQELSQEFKKATRVSLRDAAPPLFFTANSGTSQPASGTIKAIAVTNEILQVDVVSDGGQYKGSFWIDLNAKRVIKSVVDGQDMDLNTGKPFAVPLKLK